MHGEILDEKERGLNLGVVATIDQAVAVGMIIAFAMREGELSPLLASVVTTLPEVHEPPSSLVLASALKPAPHWQQLNTRPSMKAGARAHQSGTSHRKRR